jgi:hypothetical protein
LAGRCLGSQIPKRDRGGLAFFSLGPGPSLAKDLIGRTAGLALPGGLLGFMAGNAPNLVKKSPAGFEQIAIRLDACGLEP